MYWNNYFEGRTRSLKEHESASKQDNDHDKMKYYAEGMQKFERQLRLPVTNFSDVFKEAWLRK
jgi:hypothetical protein